MGLEDIPENYLILHMFIYQAEDEFKQEYETNDGDKREAFTGRTKKLQQKLKELGWHLSVHHRNTMDDAGNEKVVRRVNQDGFWYHPSHWEETEESVRYRPPVEAKTPEAEDFRAAIVVGSGARLKYPREAKTQIMDIFVDFYSEGKKKHWFGGAAGPERAASRKRVETPATALPAGVDPAMLIPGPFLNHHGVTAAGGTKKIQDGLKLLGYDVINPGQRTAVWFSKKHWEPLLGGKLGLSALTPEAEAYESKLPDTQSQIQKYLPNASAVHDIDKVIQIASTAKGASTGFGAPDEDLASKLFANRGQQDKERAAAAKAAEKEIDSRLPASTSTTPKQAPARLHPKAPKIVPPPIPGGVKRGRGRPPIYSKPPVTPATPPKPGASPAVMRRKSAAEIEREKTDADADAEWERKRQARLKATAAALGDDADEDDDEEVELDDADLEDDEEDKTATPDDKEEDDVEWSD